VQSGLPIWQIKDPLVAALREGTRLVLVAPTGSGKSTQVPQILLDESLAQGHRIVVLQPRRVAARALAARVAWERKVPLGGEVGYQVRFDDRTGEGTKISFVTEGILTRWLQGTPNLPRIGAVVFDEFHERNVLSDVALALCKRLQASTRPDLLLVVMSATLDAGPVAAYLDGCPILTSEGRNFPVTIRYQERLERRPAPEMAVEAVARIIQSSLEGDILVFMPGMGEIQATLQGLKSARLAEPLALIPLHGDLPPEAQDLAFQPQDRRKVVIATNVAETSVTIEGIRHVVDSGLARVARFDAERGLATLQIEPISRSSADQRAGRAGRTAPGTCHRLWTESGQLNRAERNTPEIRRADLAEVILLLHALHIREAVKFDWLDGPDPAAVERAEHLLALLGAWSPQSGELTPLGHQMRRLPMHPRFSRLLVEAARLGCVHPAALCAALVSGRDLLVRAAKGDAQVAKVREDFEVSDRSDFLTLMEAFGYARDHGFALDPCRQAGIHAQTARAVEQTWQQFVHLAEKHLDAPKAQVTTGHHTTALLQCITAGFIDQLCRRRDEGSLECDLAEGRHGTLARESVVRNAPLLVAASIREVDTRGARNLTLLSLATAVEPAWLESLFPHLVNEQVLHEFDRHHKRVAALAQKRFRDLVISQQHLPEVEPQAAGRCLARAHLEGLFALPQFRHDLKQFVARVNFLSAAAPEWEFPPFNAAALESRLAEALRGCRLVKEAQERSLEKPLRAHLAPEQREWLDELAPESVSWPDGRRLKLLYPDSPRDKQGDLAPPEIQVRLHECFPLREHPTIVEGKVAVKLWLGAPNGKRLESTTDWPHFKARVYPGLKANLQRKFPGVAWI